MNMPKIIFVKSFVAFQHIIICTDKTLWQIHEKVMSNFPDAIGLGQ